MARWKKENPGRKLETLRTWLNETETGRAYKKRSADYAREWRKRNPEYRKQIQARSYDKIRRECFEHYGSGVIACRCCGEDEIKFLHLDHADGDGADRRREWEKTKSTVFGGTGFYYWLKKNGWPDLRLQVLCANCNLGKRTGKFCPHELKCGFDMNGNVIAPEDLPQEFPAVTRRLRGQAEKEAAALGITARTLQARERRARSPKPKIEKPEPTHCKNGHAYADGNLYVWNGHRQCRACKQAYKVRKKSNLP